MLPAMFTGIIRHLGKLAAVNDLDDGARELLIESPLVTNLKEGDSVAVNGACLTVQHTGKSDWQVRLMPETLRRTNLGKLLPGQLVNLEQPLKVGETLDGHFVQGHVDGRCRVTAIEPEGSDRIFSFEAPAELASLLIPKGSVALDGVSLTVVDIHATSFRVSMMPYTIDHTTFQAATIGYEANIEVDLIGKYVKQLLSASHKQLV